MPAKLSTQPSRNSWLCLYSTASGGVLQANNHKMTSVRYQGVAPSVFSVQQRTDICKAQQLIEKDVKRPARTGPRWEGCVPFIYNGTYVWMLFVVDLSSQFNGLAVGNDQYSCRNSCCTSQGPNGLRSILKVESRTL